MKKIMRLLPIAYCLLPVIASGCGFVEELKHPSSFPPVYKSSYHNIDKVIAAHPLAEGENVRTTDLGETSTSIVRLVHIRKDAEIPAHTHENHDEIVYHVRGSGTAVLGGNQHPVEPGTLLLIPRNTPHSFNNDDEEDSVALSFFSPPLEGDEGEASTTTSEIALPLVKNLRDIPIEIPPTEDVKTIELGKTEHINLILTIVQEDAEISPRYHKRNDEIIFAVRGSGIIILDGTRDVVQPGSVMIIPRKALHKFINTGGQIHVALSLFSPPYHGQSTKYIKEKKKKVEEKEKGVKPVEEKLRE